MHLFEKNKHACTTLSCIATAFSIHFSKAERFQFWNTHYFIPKNKTCLSNILIIFRKSVILCYLLFFTSDALCKCLSRARILLFSGHLLVLYILVCTAVLKTHLWTSPVFCILVLLLSFWRIPNFYSQFYKCLFFFIFFFLII